MHFSELTSFAKPIHFSLFNRHWSIDGNDNYLSMGIQWLLAAQRNSGCHGISHSYSLKSGWESAYPETTGYIAKTLLLYAEAHGNEEARAAALSACNWLVSVQQESGAIVSPLFSDKDGVVFDTGQVIFGLLQAHISTGEDTYYQAAVKAADWLVEVADDGGLWTRFTHLRIPHVYNVRVAWALLELHALANKPEYLATARRNIDFAMENEQNGWFAQCAFNTDEMPFTHNLAYATRGLLEAYYHLEDEDVLATTIRTAKHALSFLQTNGFLPGRIGPGTTCNRGFTCLTGNCQFAIIWYKLHQMTGDERYLVAAESAIDYVKSTITLGDMNSPIRGAVAGSWPIWGPYARLSYPNWATKFFIDALLTRNQLRLHDGQ